MLCRVRIRLGFARSVGAPRFARVRLSSLHGEEGGIHAVDIAQLKKEHRKVLLGNTTESEKSNAANNRLSKCEVAPLEQL